MANYFSIKETATLKRLGFIPTYPDEENRKYCLYEKKIRHPLLKGLNLTVDAETIAVWCNDISSLKAACLIAERPFSEKELLSLVAYLKGV